ncbi:MAG: hypothetical protein R3D25_13650 [Geminicoccaceae bacterium]
MTCTAAAAQALRLDARGHGPGTSFHRVMYDRSPSDADQGVERVVMRSGKVYYDLPRRARSRGSTTRWR